MVRSLRSIEAENLETQILVAPAAGKDAKTGSDRRCARWNMECDPHRQISPNTAEEQRRREGLDNHPSEAGVP